MLARLLNSENYVGYRFNIEWNIGVAVCLNIIDLLRCPGTLQCKVFDKFRSVTAG